MGCVGSMGGLTGSAGGSLGGATGGAGASVGGVPGSSGAVGGVAGLSSGRVWVVLSVDCVVISSTSSMGSMPLAYLLQAVSNKRMAGSQAAMRREEDRRSFMRCDAFLCRPAEVEARATGCKGTFFKAMAKMRPMRSGGGVFASSVSLAMAFDTFTMDIWGEADEECVA